jgi:hypothetical protein
MLFLFGLVEEQTCRQKSSHNWSFWSNTTFGEETLSHPFTTVIGGMMSGRRRVRRIKSIFKLQKNVLQVIRLHCENFNAASLRHPKSCSLLRCCARARTYRFLTASINDHCLLPQAQLRICGLATSRTSKGNKSNRYCAVAEQYRQQMGRA